ncbi:hypothetical protein [Leptolyngbya sp. NIES-2104]|uniref:hypothetical protein n=1 Tax=Leptolyngbya sp. NIES-2104 TaxID=1552121 RepID=UPI0012E357D8|nr:hypothetical protein [Leptolyngbya sp. NIES-2104]
MNLFRSYICILVASMGAIALVHLVDRDIFLDSPYYFPLNHFLFNNLRRLSEEARQHLA